ncbi:putative PAS domain S-box protein [Paratrimastix pyriformis]|uniref:histidine kinase n=1 Tax=Paratrimastix pyriformis TaxID=342808 RepID=A0ABQ8UZ88_9EUKA|nr:putative PAS domain S-box protein [Paratrimastix pyriformis]
MKVTNDAFSLQQYQCNVVTIPSLDAESAPHHVSLEEYKVDCIGFLVQYFYDGEMAFLSMHLKSKDELPDDKDSVSPFKALFEGLQTPLLLLDEASQVVDMNPAAMAAFLHPGEVPQMYPCPSPPLPPGVSSPLLSFLWLCVVPFMGWRQFLATIAANGDLPSSPSEQFPSPMLARSHSRSLLDTTAHEESFFTTMRRGLSSSSLPGSEMDVKPPASPRARLSSPRHHEPLGRDRAADSPLTPIPAVAPGAARPQLQRVPPPVTRHTIPLSPLACCSSTASIPHTTISITPTGASRAPAAAATADRPVPAPPTPPPPGSIPRAPVGGPEAASVLPDEGRPAPDSQAPMVLPLSPLAPEGHSDSLFFELPASPIHPHPPIHSVAAECPFSPVMHPVGSPRHKADSPLLFITPPDPPVPGANNMMVPSTPFSSSASVDLDMRTFLVSCTPLQGLSKPYSALAMFDLTAHLAANSRETAAAGAAGLKSMKEEFLANLSHETMTPLHGLLGLAETLQSESDQCGQAHTDTAHLLVGQAKRLVWLMRDLMDYEKVKAHNIELSLQPVLAAEVVEEVVREMRPLAYQRGIALNDRVSNQDGFWVTADRARLVQILYNIVGNALRYTVRGSIAISATANQHQLEITVADTGVGIAPEMLEQIFQPFERVAQTKDVAGQGGRGSTSAGVCSSSCTAASGPPAPSARAPSTVTPHWLPTSRPTSQHSLRHRRSAHSVPPICTAGACLPPATTVTPVSPTLTAADAAAAAGGASGMPVRPAATELLRRSGSDSTTLELRTASTASLLPPAKPSALPQPVADSDPILEAAPAPAPTESDLQRHKSPTPSETLTVATHATNDTRSSPPASPKTDGPGPVPASSSQPQPQHSAAVLPPPQLPPPSRGGDASSVPAAAKAKDDKVKEKDKDKHHRHHAKRRGVREVQQGKARTEASRVGVELDRKRTLSQWILVCDDDPVCTLVLQRYLASSYEVRCFNNGLEALEWVRTHRAPPPVGAPPSGPGAPPLGPPALCILDIMMPRIGGFDMCKELRKSFNRAELPILFLSAASQERMMDECLAVGATPLSPSPCSGPGPTVLARFLGGVIAADLLDQASPRIDPSAPETHPDDVLARAIDSLEWVNVSALDHTARSMGRTASSSLVVPSGGHFSPAPRSPRSSSAEDATTPSETSHLLGALVAPSVACGPLHSLHCVVPSACLLCFDLSELLADPSAWTLLPAVMTLICRHVGPSGALVDCSCGPGMPDVVAMWPGSPHATLGPAVILEAHRAALETAAALAEELDRFDTPLSSEGLSVGMALVAGPVRVVPFRLPSHDMDQKPGDGQRLVVSLAGATLTAGRTLARHSAHQQRRRLESVPLLLNTPVAELVRSGPGTIPEGDPADPTDDDRAGTSPGAIAITRPNERPRGCLLMAGP